MNFGAVHVHGWLLQRYQADSKDQRRKSGTEDCFRWTTWAHQAGRDFERERRYDFVVRGEFDHSVAEFAHGKPLEQIAGACFRKDGKIVMNTPRPQLHTAELDALPYATDTYKRDLQIERTTYVLLHPFVSFYTTRGCPAMCTFCMWPQTISGHAWRTRSVDNVVQEVKNTLEYFPQMKEIFFDDDTFNIRRDRAIELSQNSAAEIPVVVHGALPQQV